METDRARGGHGGGAPDGHARWLLARVPVLVTVTAWWFGTLILPLTSGAIWPAAVARFVTGSHGTSFSNDAISGLPVRDGSWVVQPWLFAIGLRGAWDVAGTVGLSIVAAILAAALGIVSYAIARRVASPWIAAAAALAVYPLAVPSILQGQLVALLALAVIWSALLAGRWWLVPLVIVAWTNMHGSVPVAMGVCSLAAFGLVGEPRFGAGPLPAPRSVRWRVGWLGACAAAMFASPIGPGLITYVRKVESIAHAADITPMWRSLHIMEWRTAWLAVIAIAVIVASTRAWRAAEPGLRPRLVAIGPGIACASYLLFALTAVRNVPFVAIAALIPIAQAFESIAAARGEAVSPMAAGRATSAGRSWLVAAVIGVSCLALMLLVAPGTPFGRRSATAALPVHLVNRIPADGSSQLNGFVSAEWADYVYLRRDSSVAIDARLERYRERDLARYLHTIRHPADVDIDHLIFGYDFALLRSATAGPLIRALDARVAKQPHPTDENPCQSIVPVIRADRGVLYRFPTCVRTTPPPGRIVT